MAPEFFGFFLAMGLLAACLVLILLALLPRRLRVRKFALLSIVPVAGMFLLMVWHLRQQFFLNEPMASAASAGNIDEVRSLLERGASPDSWGVDCIETALVGAAGGGHTEIVQLLLDQGANPNLADYRGRTALALARGNGHKEIERALLKAGAKE
jgi:hypothetical protein